MAGIRHIEGVVRPWAPVVVVERHGQPWRETCPDCSEGVSRSELRARVAATMPVLNLSHGAVAGERV